MSPWCVLFRQGRIPLYDLSISTMYPSTVLMPVLEVYASVSLDKQAKVPCDDLDPKAASLEPLRPIRVCVTHSGQRSPRLNLLDDQMPLMEQVHSGACPREPHSLKHDFERASPVNRRGSCSVLGRTHSRRRMPIQRFDRSNAHPRTTPDTNGLRPQRSVSHHSLLPGPAPYPFCTERSSGDHRTTPRRGPNYRCCRLLLRSDPT